MNEYSAYVGLDVHKDTIAVAVALPGRDEPVYRGEMKNQRKSLLRLIRSLSPHGEVVSLCYEAGPCGYGVYREIIETGHHCEVVAPSLIPRRAGERVKTDRRDALKLARLHRSGELTAVWVPDEEQEAIRDLTPPPRKPPPPSARFLSHSPNAPPRAQEIERTHVGALRGSGVPVVVAGQDDVVPAQRRDVPEQDRVR